MSDPCLQIRVWTSGFPQRCAAGGKPMSLSARGLLFSSDSYWLHMWYEEGTVALSALLFCLIGLLCGMK